MDTIGTQRVNEHLSGRRRKKTANIQATQFVLGPYFTRTFLIILWRSYQKVNSMRSSQILLLILAVFYKEKKHEKQLEKNKKNKNINKTISIYPGNAGPASIILGLMLIQKSSQLSQRYK